MAVRSLNSRGRDPQASVAKTLRIERTVIRKYREVKKRLVNLVKQDPGSQAEQLSKSRNKFHPTTYQPFFTSL